MSRRNFYKRKIALKPIYLLVLITGLLLIIVPSMHPLLYRLKATSLKTCLVPYTRLSLLLSEFNSSLGAKGFLILYSPCSLTRCGTMLNSLDVPMSALESKYLKEVNIGRGILVNILIKLATNETIPATMVKSAGEHGSVLIFTWSYPGLRAILYVGLSSRKAILSVEGVKLEQYIAPKGCRLISINTDSPGHNVYIIKCRYNIYAGQLKFTRTEALFKVKQVLINKYSCPGVGTEQEYINLSLIFILSGLLLEALIVLVLRARH